MLDTRLFNAKNFAEIAKSNKEAALKEKRERRESAINDWLSEIHEDLMSGAVSKKFCWDGRRVFQAIYPKMVGIDRIQLLKMSDDETVLIISTLEELGFQTEITTITDNEIKYLSQIFIKF